MGIKSGSAQRAYLGIVHQFEVAFVTPGFFILYHTPSIANMNNIFLQTVFYY